MAADDWKADESVVKKIDAVLIEWRQGDVLHGAEVPLLVLAHAPQPLTPAALEAAKQVGGEEGSDVLYVEHVIEGLVITSQTCDVVETSATAPEIVLSPLVRIKDEQRAEEARRGWIPRFAHVPGAGDDGFADLARSMTVEKALAAEWERIQGLRTDDEIRGFQRIAERQVGRFAFPDDMKPAFDPLRSRLRDKRNKDSFEGRALRAIDDIRLLGFPDWEAESVQVDIYFLVKSRKEMDAVSSDAEKWEELRKTWQARCAPTGCIKALRVIIIPIEELDARTYAGSDAYNLGGMSPQ